MNIKAKVALATVQNAILKVMQTRGGLKTVVISIGRNIGKLPMGATAWDRFKADVMEVVDNGENKIHFTGNGNGYYEGREDSFTVIFNAEVTSLARIEQSLKPIAKKYDQEAIALTVGTTELVRGE